jgi:two-component system LytT family response regulator
MKPINAIIVDDESKSCDVLRKMLRLYCPEVQVAGIANDIESAKKQIALNDPELIFLDVELPDGNSFSLLEQIEDQNFKVIFTTAYNEYALKAFKFSALDYLLKPINIDELIAAVDKFKKNEHPAPSSPQQLQVLRESMVYGKEKIKTIGLATLNEIRFVTTDNILLLEAANNYTHFYLVNGEKITVSQTLKHYEDMLKETRFIRVHQSHIINLDKVTKYIKGKGGYVIMTDGRSIDVSPKKKTEFLSALNWD